MDLLFGNPSALYALWALIPLGAVLERARRRRRRAADALLHRDMQQRLMPVREGLRPFVPAGLVLLAFATLTFAAARPRFGVRYEQVTRRGADIVVLLDVSRSMLSDDVYPNRLERARSYIGDLTARLAGDRVALVVFAGRALQACPLTLDRGFFHMILDQVGPDTVPRGGTAIGDAIRIGLDTLDGYEQRDRAFVLITDGEDQDSFPLEAAAAAADRGVKIFTVGIGDPGEGARIPRRADDGSVTYLKHDGQEVWSKLDENTLKEIAVRTGGAYVPAQTGTYDLGQVYVDHLAQLQAGDIVSEKRKRYQERFQMFAALGLLLYLAALLVRPDRPGSFRGAAWLLIGLLTGAASASAQVPPVTGAPAPTAPQAASPATDAAADAAPPVDLSGTPLEIYNRGVQALQDGALREAVALLDHALEADPKEPRLAFASGAAHQQNHDVALAEQSYNKAASAGSPEATLAARYNLGTLAVESARQILGADPAQADADARKQGVARIEEAVGHFRAVLRIEPEHADARYNLELLRVWLKHIRDVWKKRDQEQQEQQESLDQMLLRLARAQQDLRQKVRDASVDATSPRRSETITALAREQADLADQIAPVRGKIDEWLEQARAQQQQQPQQQPAPGAAPQEDPLTQAEAWARGGVDAIDQAAREAADRLSAAELSKAEDAQRTATDGLFGLFLGFAGYERTLQAMVDDQTRLVDKTAALAEGTVTQSVPIGDLLAENQQRVKAFAPALVAKAEQVLPQIEAQLEQLSAQPTATTPPAPSAGGPGAGADPEQQREQLAQVKESVQRAIAHGGEIPPLADQALAGLNADDFAVALSPEEEILRILRDIAEPLPKNDQDQQGDDKQDQDQQDQDKQDQDKQDQDKQDQDQQDPQDKQDQDKQDQDQQDPQPQPQEITKEQLEQLMQQALDRQKEYQEKKKEMQRLLAVPVPVERDW